VVISAYGSWVERIMLNQTDPDPALGDARATLAHPHPALTDPAVREAMALAVDRALIADALYGAAGRPTCNLIAAPDAYVSGTPCPGQDIDRANAILDEAGWARGDDGIRSKDGVRLSVLYQTSTNSVRQSTQALIKQWWEEVGVETELRNIAANVFFGGDPASPDTYQKFFADVEMYTTSFDGTDPSTYMGYWTCANVPSPENNWLGRNTPRYCNPDYDALVEELAQTADLDARADLIKRMNDMLVASNVMINLVHRGTVSARSADLSGVRMNAWDTELWNIADWHRSE
jgi:peptide/nickel transport system substrate-binding protein